MKKAIECHNFMPNSWFIMGFADIIVYSGTNGYFKKERRVDSIYGSRLNCLIIFYRSDTSINKNRMVKLDE